MLNNIFITYNFHRFMQSGGYLDFFLKKVSEVFIKNVFIYLSQFFSEKYIIEYLTKKIIVNFLLIFNTYFNFYNLKYFNFFFQILIIFLYTLSLFNLFFIIF